MKPFKVAISTVGCRANQADSAALIGLLDPRRITVSSAFEGVDIAVINTCCVTAEAERDCRKRARHVLLASPDALVVLAGCAVTAIEGFGDGISPRIIKRGGPDAAPAALADWLNRQAGEPPDTDALPPPSSDRFMGRTRALLKIQTGCTHGCAYCIVPRARGKERSMPEAAVLAEVERLRSEGFHEVVLTGVQLGAWGKDLADTPRLSELIVRAADRLAPGRIRLSSIEPWSVDDALIAAVAGHDRICPHLHLPLQNGDDRILLSMRRGYDSRQYLTLIDRIRQAMPEASIGTDVLLGFPGEDEAAFQSTLAVLKAMDPAYVHAFSFSLRPHTAAARLPDRLKRNAVRARTGEVRRLGEAWSDAFRYRHIGRTHEIIVEEIRAGRARGTSDTFVKAVFSNDQPRPGALIRARVEGMRGVELLVSQV